MEWFIKKHGYMGLMNLRKRYETTVRLKKYQLVEIQERLTRELETIRSASQLP